MRFFVARRIYRSGVSAEGPYTLVAQVDGGFTEFLDNGGEATDGLTATVGGVALTPQNLVRDPRTLLPAGQYRYRVVEIDGTTGDDGPVIARTSVLDLATDTESVLLENLPTSSPTMSRRTRQLILSVAASKGWLAYQADATTAFLQGGATQTARSIFALPVAELSERLGVSERQAVQIDKAVYGLANAPRGWFRDVHKTLEELGMMHVCQNLAVGAW